MPKYVIERTLSGAGTLTEPEIQAVAQRSNEVLDALAGRAQWLQSYVCDDRLLCIYIADDEAAIREHATAGGFPCDTVNEVRRIIDPTSADAPA